MGLATKTLQIVHKPIAVILGVFVMYADVDCFLWADFLTVSTEDATKFVYLVNERYAIAIFVLARDELDAIRWTHLRT